MRIFFLILVISAKIDTVNTAEYFDGPNIVFGKLTSQYPGTYCINNNQKCYPSSLAVDGYSDDGDFYKDHCTHTSVQRETYASWTVNFGKSYYISGIKVYNRKPDHKINIGNRLQGFSVIALRYSLNDERTIYTDKNISDSAPYAPLVISIPLSDYLRMEGLRIQIPQRSNEDTVLTLCEVEVFSAWCLSVSTPNNGKMQLVEGTGDKIGNSVTTGTVLHVSCNVGFKLIGPQYLICTTNGTYNAADSISGICSKCTTWNEEANECQQISCVYPLLTNGWYKYECYTLSSNLPYGCTVQPECNVGYNLTNGYSRVCQQSGQWSYPEPHCKLKTCVVPIASGGRYIYSNDSEVQEQSAFYNESVKLQCNTGYRVNKNVIRKCQSNQTLSGYDPECIGVTCSHPGNDSVKHGLYLISTEFPFLAGFAQYSDKIFVDCDEGYVFMNGSRSRTCQTDGLWSGRGAECTLVTCPQLYSTELVQYTYNNSNSRLVEEGVRFPYETTVSVSCLSGRLVTETRRCTKNGTWSGYEPACEQTNLPVTSALSGSVIGISVGSAAFLIVVVATVLVFVARRRSHSARGKRLAEQQLHLEVSQNNSYGEYTEIQDFYTRARGYEELQEMPKNSSREAVYTNAPVATQQKEQAYYSFTKNIPKTAILGQDLADLMWSGKSATERFNKEFKRFLEGLQDRHTEALKPQNRGKNKYKNLYAYDNNRVVLDTDPQYESDYINASYIHGFQKTRAYIASQGPTKEILVDFWRMVWHTKSSKIVMLTNLMEKGKAKCDQYWPDEGTLKYGKVTVTLKEVDIYSDFIVRRFIVQGDNSPPRTISQFHFTAWPDKGVPTHASSLVHFRNKVKSDSKFEDTPITVHCSAGVGRTGTFIALDFLADEANALGYVDVVSCVTNLRKQRVNLVQTMEQYVFVHHALVETLMLASSALPASKFQEAYRDLLKIDSKTQKRKLDQEFEMLTKLSPVAEDVQYASAKNVRNRNKNRYSNILPVGEYMPRLAQDESTEKYYVNAVFLPSYKQKRDFIVTQTPLEATKEDFWRLVWEHDIHTIVMMNNVNEMKATEIYWPDVDKPVQYGNLIIANDGEMAIDHHHVINMTVTSFLLQRKVKLIQFNGWHSNKRLPDNPRVLLSLLELVQPWQRQTGNHTILVHCMNGAEKSGLFCVVYAVIERLKIEQDVAISQVIEAMRNAREQIIPTKEQYQFCHETVLAYIHMNETYSNFTI